MYASMLNFENLESFLEYFGMFALHKFKLCSSGEGIFFKILLYISMLNFEPIFGPKN